MDTPERDFPQGTIRVSDAERDAAVAELSQHFQQGRLTAEEFDERSSQAFAAKTGEELHALFADLPLVEVPPPSLEDDLLVVPEGQDVAPTGRSRGRVIAACIIAYFMLGNVVSAVSSLADQAWGSALSAIIPSVVLGLIFLAVVHRRR